MPMYSAYAQKLPGTGEGTSNPLMVAVISLLCMLALVLLALMVLANRKRKITAPVWVPPIGAECKFCSSFRLP
jgi:LPXTG-motif cell wall-anchored protein